MNRKSGWLLGSVLVLAGLTLAGSIWLAAMNACEPIDNPGPMPHGPYVDKDGEFHDGVIP